MAYTINVVANGCSFLLLIIQQVNGIKKFQIVNLAKVRRYDFTVAGTLRLELAGGMETWASRRCIPEIRRRLKGKG